MLRKRNVLVRASGPTEKQNIWTNVEKSKPNEQKQRKTRAKQTAFGWARENFRRENNNRLTRRKKKVLNS